VTEELKILRMSEKPQKRVNIWALPWRCVGTIDVFERETRPFSLSQNFNSCTITLVFSFKSA
jgi:hypothetical protein